MPTNSPVNLLIVEDDPDFRETCVRWMTRKGEAMVTACFFAPPQIPSLETDLWRGLSIGLALRRPVDLDSTPLRRRHYP